MSVMTTGGDDQGGSFAQGASPKSGHRTAEGADNGVVGAFAAGPALPWLLAGLLVLAAFGWQMFAGVNPDTTWLTVMAERWVGGERLYVDLQENNPPASVYLYVPPVVIANLLGVRSEWLVQIMPVALLGVMMWASYRMLICAGYARHFQLDWLLVCLVFVCLVMPVSTYAQREHIAAILTLPVIALAAIRASGASPAWWMVVIAGLAMGCVAAIKPPLISIAVLLAVLASVERRSWWPIVAPENWISAACFCAYGLCIVYFHPEFLRDVVPLLDDVYVRLRFMMMFLTLPVFYVMIALVFHATMVHRSDIVSPPISLVYAAAAGYFFSYILQMKYFDYHALPVAIFLMLAVCMGFLRKSSGTDGAGGRYLFSLKARLASACLIVILGGVTIYDFFSREYNGNLTAVIRQLNPAARIAGFNVLPGPQVQSVRNAGGRWVGSFGYTYVPGYAAWFREHYTVDPAWERRLQHWEKWTADVSARDIVQKKPDIIIIRQDRLVHWPTWINRFPNLGRAMEAYRFERTVDVGPQNFPVFVYVRKAAGAQTQRQLTGRHDPA